EEHHNVEYTDDAIKAAVELSNRYIGERKLPDKAIDVIDEAGAAQKLLKEGERKTKIEREDVELVVASIARIPPKNVSKSDKDVLSRLERDLKTLVFDQDEAISRLCDSIKMARAGLRDPEKPIGSYLFSGPTGVGKTEVCKQLAITLGIEFIRFDMSEYMERHAVSRLIGTPPGYVGFEQGGLLTDKIDQTPHCVLLLDEIEKAHPDIYNLLLQVMDYGKLTDNNGKTIDFRNVILVMTTNAGAKELSKAPIGFMHNIADQDDSEEIKRTFTPEFRNRLDAIVPFKALAEETVAQIVDKFVMQLEAQLSDRNVVITLSDAARKHLAKKGYDPAMGARPLARVIQDDIKKVLAEELLFGKLVDGGDVIIDLAEDELFFEYPKQRRITKKAAQDKEDSEEISAGSKTKTTTKPKKKKSAKNKKP
ncbi:MAG: AAA family ATPase, partial [Pseudomonadota bacterium]|nr:AAA family ATPase [Pseudomonadota bacterium]